MNPNVHESLDAARVAILFRALIQNAFDVIKIVDPTNKTIYCSPSVEAVLGYAPRELVGSDPLSFVHPDDAEQAIQALERVKQGPGVVRMGAIRARHKNGSWRTLEVVVQNLIDNEDVRGLVMNYRDITDRLNVELALRRTHERCEKAFQNSPDSITISYVDTGEFVEANDGFERITGYQRAETVGRTSLQMGIWKDPQRRREMVERLMEEGRVRDFEIDVVIKDGSTRSCAVSAELIELDGRQCMLAVTRDMTDVRVADERLRETTEKLRRDHVELVRKNIALNEVLEHLDKEKEQYRHELCASVENLVRPMLKKLREEDRIPGRDYDRLLETLDKVTGRHIDQFKNNVSKLTPRELDILEMIRAGHSSKQIAESLGLSSQTVHKHRQSIRRKLQIDHREINLSAYLRSQRALG
ncbi:MAG TPA: PAS domain S-box protein [Candidatus Krumholzibacteria bacterium]|nr:PAS domain S-box protein [Candidatus Krumholzibacteria bacterium]